MVVVEYLYEDMKKLVNLPLPKMVNGLSELGAPSEYEEETKKIITELTPNRPDWYSMEGLARALRAYYGKGHPKYAARKSDYLVVVDPSVAKIRPYTACAAVKGLKFNDQRITDVVLLQEKLLGTLGRRVKKFGIGIYPLHAIKFPVKYTTMEPEEIRYIPLGHEKKMSAKEIIANHKKGQQYGHLIKDYDRYPVFVDAENNVMALIPIVNSAETGKIDTATQDIFIEVTGTDINACKAALNIMVCTFADMGGTVYEVKIKSGKGIDWTPDLGERKVQFDLKRTGGVLGIDLKESEASKLLERMGYGYEKGVVIVPPYRADVLGWIDILEDIAIAYGYNNFKFSLPGFFTAGGKRTETDELDEVMRGMGFLELKTFILTNRQKLEVVGHEGNLVEIVNPSSEEYTVARPNLVASFLEVLANNKMKGLPQRFYEIGLVQSGRETKKRLIFGMMDKTVDFSIFRGHLQTLANETELDFILQKKPRGIFEPEISCVVISKGKEKGIFGKVSRKILEKFGLEFEVYLCELEIWAPCEYSSNSWCWRGPQTSTNTGQNSSTDSAKIL